MVPLDIGGGFGICKLEKRTARIPSCMNLVVSGSWIYELANP